MTSDEMKKKEQYYDCVCDVRICIGKWMDNSTVCIDCIASNSLTHELIHSYVTPTPNQSIVRHSRIGPTTRGGVVDCLLSSTVQPDAET